MQVAVGFSYLAHAPGVPDNA
ncbi:hypothetical protein EMIT0P228_130185 [Pseudomonas brassicacearum]